MNAVPICVKQDMVAGRSINLALSDRGIKALEEVGLMDEIRKICIPMHGRFMHNADGSTAYQPYGKEGQYHQFCFTRRIELSADGPGRTKWC